MSFFSGQVVLMIYHGYSLFVPNFRGDVRTVRRDESHACPGADTVATKQKEKNPNSTPSVNAINKMKTKAGGIQGSS